MRCPDCTGKAKCIDTRRSPDNKRRRRYKCVVCEHRFNTLEEVLLDEGTLRRKIFEEMKLRVIKALEAEPAP